ncbi:hypothetical protein BDV98DRAFT_110269 [Pterulicium gracile]|uniref:Uncharacterized protein n=1 Tax=Pterulicium gracile TaxID=1884261 RepID=A0A5C3QG70_9AGAR|nr:hypothetical protein BDV98DRAFT_110269 [Pterula gracilis]
MRTFLSTFLFFDGWMDAADFNAEKENNRIIDLHPPDNTRCIELTGSAGHTYVRHRNRGWERRLGQQKSILRAWYRVIGRSEDAVCCCRRLLLPFPIAFLEKHTDASTARGRLILIADGIGFL